MKWVSEYYPSVEFIIRAVSPHIHKIGWLIINISVNRVESNCPLLKGFGKDLRAKEIPNKGEFE